MHRVKVADIAAEMPLEGKEVHHLRVLRLNIGDTVQVFDGQGGEALATVDSLEPFSALLTLQAVQHNDRETPQPIILAIALLKGDKLADVVRQATELGVHRIQLLKTQFADVPDIGDNKLTRLRRIAEEASKQCRRAVIPEVLAPISLKQLPDGVHGMVAHPGSPACIAQQLRWEQPLWLASGPEGGFAEVEVQLLVHKGFIAITLGKRILRAETAPIAMLGAIAASGV